jgi:hypothetical protein
MMKKTLVALAAVAATGGAFAQATMTGGIAVGYSQKQITSGVSTGGMGVDGASIVFNVAENVEGLGKVSGKMGISAKNTDVSAYAKDTVLKLDMGSSGAFTMQSVYSSSWLGGVASSGSVAYCSFTIGDCTSGVGIFSTYGYNDDLIYSLKLSDSLAVSVSHTEPSAASAGLGAGGIGTTIASAGNGARYNTFSATYTASALVITGGYRTYDLSELATSNSKTRNRAALSYDLGIAKVSAGYEQTATTYGATTTDTVYTVATAVPNSALSLSASFGTRAKAGNAASTDDTTYSGSIYAASYALSKRTSLNTTYLTNQGTSTTNPNFFIATINHSF